MIKIADSIKDLVPTEFKNLTEGTYTLTKTENFRVGFVYSGDTVTGPLEIVDIIDKPGVKVTNTLGKNRFDFSYIRTSPIVEVLDTTDTTITFKTEGGVYKLEKIDG